MDKILEILKKNNLTNCDITPIGHHQLDRNYVYWIKGDEEYILKVYQKEIKYLCEKRGLKTFEANPMIPQMIDYGEKEFFWILSKKIEGHILEEIWPNLNLHLQKKTVELLGELLGGIHKKKKDTYFGGWVDMPQRPIFFDFIEYRKQNDHRILTRIKDQSLPDQELFNKAFDTLKNYYKYLNPQSISSITHRDFSYRNMLVEKNNNQIILKGLIDFEHCQMDDPCIDFNPLYQYDMLYNKELEEIFFKTYKKNMNLPEDFETRKKYYMINLGLHTCSWSFNVAKDYYSNGIELLNKLV